MYDRHLSLPWHIDLSRRCFLLELCYCSSFFLVFISSWFDLVCLFAIPFQVHPTVWRTCLTCTGKILFQVLEANGVESSALWRILLGFGIDWILSGRSADWIRDRVGCAGRISACSYVIGQSAPFISSLYAIFYWKEFKKASRKTWFYEICMLSSLAISVIFLCFAQ